MSFHDSNIIVDVMMRENYFSSCGVLIVNLKYMIATVYSHIVQETGDACLFVLFFQGPESWVVDLFAKTAKHPAGFVTGQVRIMMTEIE
jgi:hypothetical protein